MTSYLEEGIQLLAATEVELIAKGFSPAAVQQRLEKALNEAKFYAEPLSDDIKEQGIRDYLRQLLTAVEQDLTLDNPTEEPA